MRRKIFLVLMCLSILGLLITNIFGIFKVFIVNDPSVFEFILSFFATFFFLLLGAAIMDYEGRGTPEGILINALFYFFLISMIVLIIIVVRIKKRKKILTNPEVKPVKD